MKSLWTDSINIQKFNSLQEDIKTDVLIIGGGMAGLLVAHFLQEEGCNYVLVEGNRIGHGVTQNTTAKITSQHGLIYHKLIKSMGIEKAMLYLNANESALTEYKKLSQKIPCDYEEKSAYIFTLNNVKELEDEYAALDTLFYDAKITNQLPLPFPIKGAIQFPNQGQFHPLKFISGIAKGLHIFENTPVISLDGNKAVTPNATIVAKKIIVTTHFPFLNTHGSYFLKMYQHRSYLLALQNAPNLDGMYKDAAQNGMSFRNYKDLLLVGGGSHRTGKNGGNWEELRAFSNKYYPQAKEVYRFATQDCMTLDGIPYIGQYSKRTPDLYVATGFHKWGMSTSMVASMILSKMVLGKESPFAPVFSPSRSIVKPQLFINGFETLTNFLTPSKKRCPHLGCTLKWNKVEHTWDCPCHGSRFEKNGDLLDNPATGPIKGKWIKK